MNDLPAWMTKRVRDPRLPDRVTTTPDGLRVEGSRTHGRGPDGGQIHGWIVFAGGRSERSWGISLKDAALNIEKNVRYYGSTE